MLPVSQPWKLFLLEPQHQTHFPTGIVNTRRTHPRVVGIEKGLEEETHNWSFLEDQTGDVRLPQWLVALDREQLSDNVTILDAELMQLARVRRELDSMTGRILFTMARCGLFRKLQFWSIGHYARERLGLSARKARELKQVEFWLFFMPWVQEAYFEGKLGMSKLRQLIRMPGGDDRAWLERAQSVTARRLEDEMRFCVLRNHLIAEGLMEPTDQEREEGLEDPPPAGLDLKRHMSSMRRPALVKSSGSPVKVRDQADLAAARF